MDDPQPHQLDYGVKRLPEVNWRSAFIVSGVATILIAGLFLVLSIPPNRPFSSYYRLRMITSNAIGYATDHGEAFPDSFESLVRSEWTIDAEVFASPKGPATPAPDHETMFREPGHISYIWLGRGLTMQTVQADTPLAYEGPVTDFEAGTWVGFVDGSVRRVQGEALRELLREAEERLERATTAPATRPQTEEPTTRPTAARPSASE